MRIGLVAPPWIPVPPPSYGGTEVVVDNLARGLAALGHDVRLFTVGESTCPVTRLYRYPRAVEPMGNVVHEVAHALSAYEALADVDVIHDHTVVGPLVAPARPAGPGLAVTHHGPFSADLSRIFSETGRRAATVAVSHAQARSAGAVPIAAVIHHGIDLAQYVPGPGGGGYLLFLGRMSADKGAHRALTIARRAGRPLVIVTKMRDTEEQDYFRHKVRPLLRPGDELLIEPGIAKRLDLLRHAEALINPITWPEPFGLVMAEALACGTPVFAFPHGAAPEIIEHGRVGFLCANQDEMVAALEFLHTLDRTDCRAVTQERFSLERMARDHERLYRRILADGRPPVVRQVVNGPRRSLRVRR